MVKRGYIIILFVLSLAIVSAIMWFTYQNVQSLSQTIIEAQKPDTRINKLKEFTSHVNNIESGVRSFAITRNKKYLDTYFELANSIDEKTDSLKNIFKEHAGAIDSLTLLMKQKLLLYDELIDLRYTELMNEAVKKISGKIIETPLPAAQDTTAEVKKGFFRKIFGTSKRRKELEAKAHELDSLNAIQEIKLKSIRNIVESANQNEMKIINALTEKELQLLEQDRILKIEIEKQLQTVEQKIENSTILKSESRIADANKQMQTMLLIAAGAGILILVLAVVVLLDINRAKRYKKQLIQAKEKAEQLAKFKEEFLATMSHEIRTPLSALTGFSKKLAQTNTSAEQQQYIRTINAAGHHLLGIVNDVLDLSRIETGKLKLVNEPFSVFVAVNDVCSLLSVKANEKNILLSADAEAVKYDVVNGDELRLKQALINIVGNAIKFTEKGGIKIEVQKQLGTQQNSVSNFKFQISDSGIGIAKEKLSHIFEAYTHVANVEKKYGGTGLGLSITKKIIELQNGTISVDSVLGRGTTVNFEIPFQILEELKDQPAKIIAPITLNNLSGLKVLLAEDDELNRELAYSALKQMNADVAVVSSGRQAIEEVLMKPFDSVLMDIQMPVMNGKEATAFIREHVSKTLPIIGITANVMNDARQECTDAGMNEIILKPFDQNSIVPVLLPLISKHQAALSNQNIFSFSTDSLTKASNGKRDFVVKMLKVFISSNKSLLEKTALAANESNFEQAASYVHRLIPSFRQLSLDAFANRLKNLEWLCLNAENKTAIGRQVQTTATDFITLEKILQEEIERLEKL